MTDKVKQYITVYNQIKQLELQKEQLALEVVEEMDDSGQKSVETEQGFLTLSERTTWEYSGNIKSMEDHIKDLKKKEELANIATIKSVSRFIRFVKPDQIRFPRIG